MSIWEWMAVVGVMGLLAFLVVAIVLLVYQLQNVIERMDAAMVLHEARSTPWHPDNRGEPPDEGKTYTGSFPCTVHPDCWVYGAGVHSNREASDIRSLLGKEGE